MSAQRYNLDDVTFYQSNIQYIQSEENNDSLFFFCFWKQLIFIWFLFFVWRFESKSRRTISNETKNDRVLKSPVSFGVR